MSLISLLLCTFLAFEPPFIPRMNRELDGLKGQVKSVRWERYYLDVQTNMDRSIELMKLDQPVRTNFYNKNGVRVKTTFDGFDHSDDPITSYEFIHDENGNLIYWDSYNLEGNRKHRLVILYNEEGKAIGEKSYLEDGSWDKRWVYSFDEQGRKTGITIYNSDGTLSSASERLYFDEDLKIVDTEQILFFPNQKQIEKFHCHEYHYDLSKNGELVKSEQIGFDEDGIIESRYEMYFEHDGKIIKEIASHLKSLPSHIYESLYEYEYDDYGNWVLQLKFADFSIDQSENIQLTGVVKREIQYYPD